MPVAQTISKEQLAGTTKRIKEEYAQFRIDYQNRKKDKNFVSIEAARSKRMPLAYEALSAPTFTGNKTLVNFPLEQLRKRIDWTPFFSTWELSGKYPAILTDKIVGVEATKLFHDANKLLDEVIANNLLQARGVVGFYEANSQGDDVVIQTPTGEQTFHFLRQQNEKTANQPYLCLADFVAPKELGKPDHMGFFAVTAGIGIEPLIEKFEKDHDDYKHTDLIKAIADRLAEAFAEKLHELVRTEYWGFAKGEQLSDEEIIRENYQSIRPAPGYPACPDHTEKRKLFNLLKMQKKKLELHSQKAMLCIQLLR